MTHRALLPALCLLGLLLLALPACGDGEEGAQNPAAPPAGKNPPALAQRRIVRRDMFAALEQPRFGRPPSTLGAVLHLELAGGTRAYPMRQMAYHGAVNDIVDGQPILVTYNVLAGTVSVFSRAGNPTDVFGVMGFQGRALLLYDRRTESTWNVTTGLCVDGFRAGEVLTMPGGGALSITPGADFRRTSPDTPVLIAEPRFAARYYVRPGGFIGPGPLPPGLTGRAATPLPEERFHGEPGLFPVLDNPRAVAADAAPHMQASDEVLGVTVGGAHRAYPAFIMAYFHAANDVVGGQPVFVTFCAVCASGTAYDPRVPGDPRTLQFGFEGILDGLPVYFDRQTRSRWMHVTAHALDGWFGGAQLKPVGVTRYTTWGAWRASHPETTVLDVDTAGLPGDYSVRRASYRGQPFVPEMMRQTMGKTDLRLPAHTLCLGLVHDGDALAIPFKVVRAAKGVYALDFAGAPAVALLHPEHETAIALRPHAVDAGRALHLHFTDTGGLVDRETGSSWSLDGVCLTGPLLGDHLTLLGGRQIEWYGWTVAHPKTRVAK